MTVTAGTTHDVTFDHENTVVGFMIDPGSYRSERVDDFAPRISTGDDPAYRESFWNAWVQSNFTEGVDQTVFENRNRFYSSDGNIFASRPEGLQLNSAWNSSETSKAATAPQMIDFVAGSDFVITAIGTKIRRYNIGAATWTDSTTTLGASAVWLHRHGAYVFAACGSGADLYRSSDLITWTQPAAGQKASGFCSWERGTSIYLVLWTGTTFKTSTDSGATWSTAVSVGNPYTNITGIESAFGVMVIGKEDGLYYYDGTNVVEEMTFANRLYAYNCRALVYWDGFLYTSILDRVYKLSFSGGGLANMVDITPVQTGTSAREIWGHGIPVWMWASPTRLYVLFDDGQSTYTELLTYNGTGWQQEYLSGTSVNPNAGGYSRLSSRVWINTSASSGTTLYRGLRSLGDAPTTDYPATGVITTSDFDAGLPLMFKAWRDVFVELRDVSGSGQVLIECSVDRGTTWTTVGTATANGRQLFSFPSSTRMLADQRLRLRFTLSRNSATSSPVLVRFGVNFLNRPNPIYGYSITLKLANGQVLRDSTGETLTVAERVEFLQSCEGSSNPVMFTDMLGESYLVYITKTSAVRSVEKHDAELEDERTVNVTMVDAVPSARWDDAYWDAFYWA